MHDFNQSLSYDKRMFKADIKGSQAYALALNASGLLSSEEYSSIRTGLEEVLREWETSAFVIHETDEDIHTANERRLMEKIGKVAGKLHTGRSRNDQVATDMRLWLMEECDKLLKFIQSLIKVITSRAQKEIDILMPGYTHLQVSLPTLVTERSTA
jgi:argininosuccinate lyase